MINKKLIHFSLITLVVQAFAMLFCIPANAQTFPISSQLQLSPPYSVYFSDLLRPEADQVKLNLLLRDLQEPFLDVRLRLKVEGPGITLETAPWYQAPAITLESGIPRLLTSVDLAGYFDAANLNFGGISRGKYEQQGGRLPEGLYRISFTVLDVTTGRQLSQPGQAIAWMALSEPPRLNLPFCDAEISLDNGQQYIVFQWSPIGVSPNTYGEQEYEFTLTEIRPTGRDPYEAMRTLPPVYQFSTSETSLVYDNDEPLLIPGMAYAWRIQAKDINGKERFREQGFSPVCTFRVAETALPSPMGVRAEAITSYQGRAYWDLNPEVEDYRVEYRVADGTTWYGINEPEQAGGPIDGELNISGLAPGNEYEVRVGSRRDGLVSSWSESVYFTTQEEQVLACGDVAPIVPIEEFDPLPSASVGDVIAAGNVDLTLVSFTGSNGVYSGWGTVKINFLGNRIPVEFTNIKINKNYRMIEGFLYSMQSSIDDYIRQWREEHADQDSTTNDGGHTNTPDSTNTNGDTDYINYDGEIDSVYVNDGGLIVVVDENGDTETFEPDEDGGTTFVDASGDVWHVDENGEVSDNEVSDIIVNSDDNKDKGYYLMIPNDTTKYKNGDELVLIRHKGELPLAVYSDIDTLNIETLQWKIAGSETCKGKSNCNVDLSEKGNYKIEVFNGSEKVLRMNLNIYKKPIVVFENDRNFDGDYGFDGAGYIQLRNAGDYEKLNFNGTDYYVPVMTFLPNQTATIQFYAKGLENAAKKDRDFKVTLKSTNGKITLDFQDEITIPYDQLAGLSNPRIPVIIQIPNTNTIGRVDKHEYIVATDHKGELLGKIAISYGKIASTKDVKFVYVNRGNGCPSWSVDDFLNFTNLKSHNQFFRNWHLHGVDTLDITEDFKKRNSKYLNSETALETLKEQYKSKFDIENTHYFFLTDIPVKGEDGGIVGGQAYTGGAFGALYNVNNSEPVARESTAHEFGHLLGLQHPFSSKEVGARAIPKGTTKSYMDYVSKGRNMFFIYQMGGVK
ncbi:fibronectin type III domain-containing protein [Fulvivirga sp. 29W222]|uniref:Fibronectin type III domain-containing protein n=1 Tax=Fulvivirga marina TaxID=2494733 RepID=A0A937KB75_9BACT|nr:fibronectin type III domain-containing protein [Fulvivirga marina]MBL6445697.1 fibronectin type III domain-containing protein [Fulvivirga marina]